MIYRSGARLLTGFAALVTAFLLVAAIPASAHSATAMLAAISVPTETPSVGSTPDPSTSADREEKKAQKRAERAARNQAEGDGDSNGSSEDTVARGLGVAALALSAVAVGLGIIVLRRPGG
jgi:hypothetical protein